MKGFDEYEEMSESFPARLPAVEHGVRQHSPWRGASRRQNDRDQSEYARDDAVKTHCDLVRAYGLFASRYHEPSNLDVADWLGQ